MRTLTPQEIEDLKIQALEIKVFWKRVKPRKLTGKFSFC